MVLLLLPLIDTYATYRWLLHLVPISSFSMIIYTPVRPGPPRRGDWRSDPYLCGLTEVPTRRIYGPTRPRPDDYDPWAGTLDPRWSDVPF